MSVLCSRIPDFALSLAARRQPGLERQRVFPGSPEQPGRVIRHVLGPEGVEGGRAQGHDGRQSGEPESPAAPYELGHGRHSVAPNRGD